MSNNEKVTINIAELEMREAMSDIGSMLELLSLALDNAWEKAIESEDAEFRTAVVQLLAIKDGLFNYLP